VKKTARKQNFRWLLVRRIISHCKPYWRPKTAAKVRWNISGIQKRRKFFSFFELCGVSGGFKSPENV
jgi:hypothetical protein